MSAVPMTYVIGRDGKVVDAWYGYDPDRNRKSPQEIGAVVPWKCRLIVCRCRQLD